LNFKGVRKLSGVLLLSDPNDFEGGEFQINIKGDEKPLTVEMKRGRMVLFPSFMLHRLKPVISVVRKTIVIWVEGPKWK
jgi:PKHD-type hydroxylase